MSFYNRLEELLRSIPEYVDKENNLLKNKIINDIEKNNVSLLTILLSCSEIRQEYFIEVEGTTIFCKDKFIMALEDKNFLANSYTRYKNKIGLVSGATLLKSCNDVVLNFPFKDCYLEGGQTKDADKRKELFFNEILAKDEIDRLLDPKAFTNFKKITKEGEKPLDTFTTDENGTIKDNLLIKGNNLVVLHSIKERFAGKVKLIYIDPPYNTGNDSFNYNDNFNHSSWLVFMKNRLEVARELLREDGVIFVQCDDNEHAYLKVLMDEIFGRENFLNTISLKTKGSAGVGGGGEEERKLKKNVEFINIYCKNKESVFLESLYTKIPIKQYINEHKEKDIGFYYTRILLEEGTRTVLADIDGIKVYEHTDFKFSSVTTLSKEKKTLEIDIYNDFFDKIFMVTNAQTSLLDKINKLVDDKNKLLSYEYIPSKGRCKNEITTKYVWNKTLVVWFKDSALKEGENIYKKEQLGTLWNDISWGRIDLQGGVKLKNGKKPEKLLERIIEMSTQEGDIVLDFFAGSGTTPAVAHKMGRQYIAIEQMDYIEDITKARLQKVIGTKVQKESNLLEELEYDTGGISKSVEWKGGGECIYMELAPFNELYAHKIKEVQNKEELLKLYNILREQAFLDYRWDLQKELHNDKDFTELPLEEQKAILLTILDKNQMYIAESEMEDTQYNMSIEDIRLTQEFYTRGI